MRSVYVTFWSPVKGRLEAVCEGCETLSPACGRRVRAGDDERSADVALRLSGLRQLLQGPTAAQHARDRLRAPRGRCRRSLRADGAAGRAEPSPARPNAPPRRWPGAG